jgi:hypothetical protein
VLRIMTFHLIACSVLSASKVRGLVTVGVVGTGSRAHSSGVISCVVSWDGGHWKVLAAVWVIGAR